LRTEKTSEKSEVKDYIELEDIEQGTGKIIGFRDTLEVSSDVTVFKNGDVLFGKLRPYLAKYWLADRNGKCTGEIIAFYCNKIENTFFKFFICSPKFIETCTAVAYGAKMPRVDWTRQIAYFYIAFPEKEEQRYIGNYLENLCNNIQNEKNIIEAQIAKLGQYRKSLIHECVTGKRKVV
jgi:restriction endonuclease S subunit